MLVRDLIRPPEKTPPPEPVQIDIFGGETPISQLPDERQRRKGGSGGAANGDHRTGKEQSDER